MGTRTRTRTRSSGRGPGAREAEQLPLLLAPTPRRVRPAKRGRPKKLGAGAPHKPRPSLSRHHPVHVVLRIVQAVGTLRRRLAHRAIREATFVSMKREDC